MEFIAITVVAVFVAAVATTFRIRLDLTEDKRYTLSGNTKQILAELNNDIFIEVYLDGDMPVPLKRLKRAVRESLDEFRIASRRKIDYMFINPYATTDDTQRQQMQMQLIEKGLVPFNIQANDNAGGTSMRMIFPGMILNSNGTEIAVNILSNNQAIPYEQNILHSQEGLEYNLIQTIRTIDSDTIYKVAFIEGHNELSETETADITMSLARFFTVDRGEINGTHGILDPYAAVIVAGPDTAFGEADKLVLDQYVMNGGKVLWLAEEVSVNADSLAAGSAPAIYRQLNIDDMLFTYGARINPLIVQDIECQAIRLMVMSGGSRQQVVPVPWIYYPLLSAAGNHPVTRNLNRVKGEFVNYIDTVGLDGAIRKHVLLHTSPFTRTVSPPVVINLREAENPPAESEFNKASLPVAVLLEGTFASAFSNRPVAAIAGNSNFRFVNKSAATKMIVVADADIIRNEVSRAGGQETPLRLGVDKYTGQVFGNKDFIVNCVNWLVDDSGIMELRSRELKMRLLNQSKVRNEKTAWQVINTVCPLVLLLLAGIAFGYIRKLKYTKA